MAHPDRLITTEKPFEGKKPDESGMFADDLKALLSKSPRTQKDSGRLVSQLASIFNRTCRFECYTKIPVDNERGKPINKYYFTPIGINMVQDSENINDFLRKLKTVDWPGMTNRSFMKIKDVIDGEFKIEKE